MSKKTIDIRNKSDVPLHGLQPNAIITIEVDRDGVPFKRHWRRRLNDSKIDGCVEILKKTSKAKDGK